MVYYLGPDFGIAKRLDPDRLDPSRVDPIDRVIDFVFAQVGL